MKYTATVDGTSFPVLVEEDRGLFTVEINGKEHSLDVRSSPGSSLHSIIVEGKQYEVVVQRNETGLSIYIDGETHAVQVSEETKAAVRKGRKASLEIKAAMPGLVVAVEVKAGQEVDKDQGLIVLEAMKMQNEVKAPSKGVVAQIHIRKGSAVEKGEKLVTLETR
jgi:pyruvate carboxylase subunit B